LSARPIFSLDPAYCLSYTLPNIKQVPLKIKNFQQQGGPNEASTF
jgi:hypothetical protein